MRLLRRACLANGPALSTTREHPTALTRTDTLQHFLRLVGVGYGARLGRRFASQGSDLGRQELSVSLFVRNLSAFELRFTSFQSLVSVTTFRTPNKNSFSTGLGSVGVGNQMQ